MKKQNPCISINNKGHLTNDFTLRGKKENKSIIEYNVEAAETVILHFEDCVMRMPSKTNTHTCTM